jgi:hypothetical protein
MTENTRPSRAGRYVLIAATVAATAFLGAAALPASAAPASGGAPGSQSAKIVSPDTGSECAAGVCIVVNGSGLYVGSVTVTNSSAPTGPGQIININGDTTHTGPTLSQYDSYTYTFNRTLQNGDQICGVVGSRGEPCVTITG